jgi:glycosyltransferase involved in cell wall biosynthesis
LAIWQSSLENLVNTPKMTTIPPILTILVPTYNRVFQLQNLLESFFLRPLDPDIEILVAINASNDGTKAIAEIYKEKIPNLKNIYFEEFLHSAEENISRSFQYCSGKYVFILGDDDPLLMGTFDLMISILRNDKSNLPALIFNNISSSNAVINFFERVGNPSFISLANIDETEKKIWYSDYSELLKELGVTGLMAFISRYIIRRDLVRDFSSHINVSRIYSHVFSFLFSLHVYSKHQS